MICRYKKITYFCTRVLCPGGGIGRRAGLKIQCPQQTCGFDSRPGYAKNQEVKLCLTSFFCVFPFRELGDFLWDFGKSCQPTFGLSLTNQDFILFRGMPDKLF